MADIEVQKMKSPDMGRNTLETAKKNSASTSKKPVSGSEKAPVTAQSRNTGKTDINKEVLLVLKELNCNFKQLLH